MRLLMISAAMLAISPALAGASENVSKSYPLAGFSKVHVEGVYDVDIAVGPQWSVKFSGDAESLARSSASVSNGALVLSTQKRDRREKRKDNKHSVTAIVTMPALDGINVTGVGDLKATGVDANAFEVKLSGVGDIDLSGRCEAISVELAGVGDVNAEGLKCRNARARLAGVGDVAIFASDEADAAIAGIGGIDIYGSPRKISKNKSMLSEITVH